MLAIVWPALTKPLATSDLREAAADLRQHLAQARTLSMSSGEPVLVRVDAAEGTVAFATWRNSQLMPSASMSVLSKDDLSSVPALAIVEEGTDDFEINRPALNVEIWEAPDSIRLGSVAYGGQTANDRATLGAGDLLATTDSTASELDQLTEFDVDSDETELRSLNSDPSESIFWLWFLPQGQACEASLDLVDTRTKRLLEMKLIAWNGEIQLGKPQDLAQLMEADASDEFETTDRLPDDTTSDSLFQEDSARDFE